MLRREFLTAAEAAQIVGISDRHIRRLARAGDIPAYRFGKLWKFDPKELREFCANKHPRTQSN